MNLLYKIIFVLFFGFILFANVIAEEETTSFEISLAQDPSFGFYPSIYGSIPINESTNFTFYGVYWTQDVLGGNKGGLNLLTEYGFGVNFSLADGALNINPSLGFAHGNYQSGGGRPVIADNIVPSLIIEYSTGNFSCSASGIYWKSFRNESNVTPLINMIEYNFNFGWDLNKYFNVGLFYDHLFYGEDNSNQVKDSESSMETSYLWLGPMVTINFKENASVMFTIGPDFVDYLNSSIPDDAKSIKEYYKLSTTISF